MIDVCILENIGNMEESAIPCSAFLYLQMDKYEHICLDADGIIFSVYESHVDLHNPSDPVGKWWKFICHNNLIRNIFAHLPKKRENVLLELKFHKNDLVFVKVAFKSVSKRIVSLDSDFGCNPSSPKNREDIKELLESFGIHTLTPEEAITDLSNLSRG